MELTTKLIAGQAVKKVKKDWLGDEEEEQPKEVYVDNTPPKKIVPAREKRRYFVNLLITGEFSLFFFL